MQQLELYNLVINAQFKGLTMVVPPLYQFDEPKVKLGLYKWDEQVWHW
jgi:hypothetical protein